MKKNGRRLPEPSAELTLYQLARSSPIFYEWFLNFAFSPRAGELFKDDCFTHLSRMTCACVALIESYTYEIGLLTVSQSADLIEDLYRLQDLLRDKIISRAAKQSYII